jgi:AraC-like DNA-binding protein
MGNSGSIHRHTREIEQIGSLARQVGCRDQAYFSRVFHRLTGLSPQACRDSSEEKP